MKRHGPLFWLAARSRGFKIRLALFVLYLLMLGPVAWLGERGLLPRWVRYILAVVYFPIILIGRFGPDWLRDALNAFGRFWGSL